VALFLQHLLPNLAERASNNQHQRGWRSRHSRR
jgi:hypothetical protein